MQHKERSSQIQLLDIALEIVESSKALVPFRFDFKPMSDVTSPEQIPDIKACQRFFDEYRIITNIIAGRGAYESNRMHLTVSEFIALRLYEATMARELRVTNCDVATSHVLKFLIENKIDVPFTILGFNHYEHAFAMLGANFRSVKPISLPDHQEAFKDVIIIDLWNRQKPIMTIYQFKSVMEDLLCRENLLRKGSPKTNTMDLTAEITFHVASPLEYQNVYQYCQATVGATLEDYRKLIHKRFAEQTIPDYRSTRAVVPKSISPKPLFSYTCALNAGFTLFCVGVAAAAKFAPHLLPKRAGL